MVSQAQFKTQLTSPTPAIADPGGRLSSAERKALGAYYTPPTVASILAQWAIRSQSELILEPGFGGCEFLQAAIDRLKVLNCESPGKNLFGCDIDRNAFSYLSDKLGVVGIEGRYLFRDFISIRPADFSQQKFDVALGNPPYVSHHNMSIAQRENVWRWRSEYRTRLSGRASLWAYFVLHAMQFLRDGGRMVWVLPGSTVNADYGSQFLSEVANHFQQVVVVELGERVFLDAGAKEQTVVLACIGYGQANVSADFRRCDTVEALAAEFASPTLAKLGLGRQVIRDERACSYTTFEDLESRLQPRKLGDLSRVIIGTVTGANRFFILPPSKAKELGLSDRYLRPIVPKFGLLRGAKLDAEDVEALNQGTAPCMLFHVPSGRIGQAAKDYIASFSEEEIQRNSTFSRRDDWLKADDGRIPGAFLSYMTHDGPRIVLNNARINCTNTVHRLFFNDGITTEAQKLVAISLSTTFSQLSAELEGRNYGSGVLKIEPSEAKRISLVLPDHLKKGEITAAFDQFDACLRTQGPSAANEMADQLILGASSDERDALRRELGLARSLRRYSRNGR
jgi:hypothetical protein